MPATCLPTRQPALRQFLILLVATAMIGSLVSLFSPATAQAAGPEVLRLPATAATYVSNAEPSKNFSQVNGLLATSTIYQTYLKFDTAQLRGRQVQAVELRVGTRVLQTSKPGVIVRKASTGWSPTTLTARNRPNVERATLTRSIRPQTGAHSAVNFTNISGINTTGETSLEVTYGASASGFVMEKSGTLQPTLYVTLAGPAPDAKPDVKPKPDTNSRPLPFESAGSGTKLVFAHYFTPYPISLDNAPPANDYYARHYLKASGENGKFNAYGGLLRDRPIPRDPIGGDWRLEDAKTEVRQAMGGGINGFAVDLLSFGGFHWEGAKRMLRAAEQVSPTFKIMLQPDMTSGVGSASSSQMADKLAELSRSSATYRLSDGRVVISPFAGERRSTAYWSEVMNIMASRHGIKTALMPVFIDPAPNLRKFAPISYGMGEWGMRDPGGIKARPDYAGTAHSLGKKWISSITVQDVRPTQRIYDEAGNTEALRASWQRALDDKAEFALITTWNDYSESTSIAPSTDHGYAFLDISAYYAARFTTGSYPKTSADALYLSHRVHNYQMVPTQQSGLARLRSSRTPARNNVEVLSFLTAPAEVRVQVGSKSYTYTAPAGVSVKTFGLQTGSVSASASRKGSNIAAVTSPDQVVSSAPTADLSYHAVTSRRPNPRTR